MKKVLLLATLIMVLFLTGCGKTYEDGYAEGYDTGYDDGYIEGFSDSKVEWFDYADDMYDEGHDDGFEDGAEAAAYYVEDTRPSGACEDGIIILEGYFQGVYSREQALEALEWISDYWDKTETALLELSKGEANLEIYK